MSSRAWLFRLLRGRTSTLRLLSLRRSWCVRLPALLSTRRVSRRVSRVILLATQCDGLRGRAGLCSAARSRSGRGNGSSSGSGRGRRVGKGRRCVRTCLFTWLRRRDGRCSSSEGLAHSSCGRDRLHVRRRVWRGGWDRSFSKSATRVDGWLDSIPKSVERLQATFESNWRVSKQREGCLLRPLAIRGDGVCGGCESRGVAERRSRGLMRSGRRG